MNPTTTLDIGHIGAVCAAIMAILGFVFYMAKLYRDWFVKPWLTKELAPIKTELSLIARLLREKYREEYEQAQQDLEREERLKGVS